jgi:hypothetical protein
MEERKGKLGKMKPKSRKFSRPFFILPHPQTWRQKQLEGHVIWSFPRFRVTGYIQSSWRETGIPWKLGIYDECIYYR